MRKLLVVASALLAGSALLAAVDACTIVNGLEVPPGDAGASGDTLTTADTAPIDPCDHARPPPKPSGADLPGDQTIVVVAKRFDVGTGDVGAPVGFDLDNACSCPVVAETCIGRKQHCDNPGGRDNATGSLFNTLLGLPTAIKLDFVERINSSIRMGKNTILIRVTGFNGTSDDPSVIVSVYASLGLLDGAGKYVKPDFKENEQWALDDRQFPLSTSVPNATTLDAYVADGKLVANLAITLDLSDDFSIALTGSTLQGDLSLTGNAGKPTITGGLITGRWPVSDILRVAGKVGLEDGGTPICENAGAYATLKNFVCEETDLVADRARDKTGAACDALSAGIVFEAGPASLGAVKKGTPSNDCPDARPDDCTK